MRVISGKYRGRKILPPADNEIRPTSDMTREGIFNVIQFDIEGSRFVDLFAGSGAMGIEALSRGCAEVVFNDCGRQSLKLLPQNLKGIDGNYKILSRDFRDTLRVLKGKWNYIFCDPPYNGDYLAEIAKTVKERQLLEDDGYLIYEHDNDSEVTTPKGFVLVKSKHYGRARVEFYSVLKSVCAVTGSFDPFTKGHRYIVENALKKYEEVVVLIAINEQKKQLFTLHEREQIIKASLSDLDRVKVDICEGMVYEYCNQNNISNIVRGVRNSCDLSYENEMSEYNSVHGGITTEYVMADEEMSVVSATKLRANLKDGKDIDEFVCDGAVNLIKNLYNKKLQ